MDTTTATPALRPRVGHILRLAEIIREVHDSTITIEALALAILAHPGFSGCHDGPDALPAQGEVQELVAELHRIAEDARAAGWITDAEYLTRSAILLQQQATPAASPAAEDLTRFATWLRSHSSQCVELGRPDWAHMADRAADLLEGFSRGGSTAPTVEQSTPPPLPPVYNPDELGI